MQFLLCACSVANGKEKFQKRKAKKWQVSSVISGHCCHDRYLRSSIYKPLSSLCVRMPVSGQAQYNSEKASHHAWPKQNKNSTQYHIFLSRPRALRELPIKRKFIKESNCVGVRHYCWVTKAHWLTGWPSTTAHKLNFLLFREQLPSWTLTATGEEPRKTRKKTRYCWARFFFILARSLACELCLWIVCVHVQAMTLREVIQ